MSFINGANLRKLIPAGAVAAVVGFSFIAQVPSAASSTNNCGVKGYGYHDHGKVCPNRPFPGKGEGLEKFLGGGAATTGGSNAKGETEGTAVATTDNDTVAAGGGVTLSLDKGHGHAKGHSHSHGGGKS